MKIKSIICIVLISLILITGCTKEDINSKDNSQLPNPASVYCKEQGGTSEIRTNPDGSQTGYCVFQDGSECEEWSFYRRECQK